MKKIIFLILFQVTIFEITAQSNDEYLILCNEINKIVDKEFILPVKDQEIHSIVDSFWGYGYKRDIFTDEIWFSNVGLFRFYKPNCIFGMPVNIYSMTDGIVENIFHNGIYGITIVIKFEEIEICYMLVLPIDNIQKGSTIKKGDLIGCIYRSSYYCAIGYGLMLNLKYKNYYFDLSLLLSRKIYYHNYSLQENRK